MTARLFYAKVTGTVVGPQQAALAGSSGTTGNVFRYDPASKQYLFNWSTKGLAKVTYPLTIDPSGHASDTFSY